MKALPRRLSGTWQKAKCDPDGKAEYLIEPPSERLRFAVQADYFANVGEASDVKASDIGGAVFDIAQYCLKGIRGIEDEGGEFQLEFTTNRLAGRDWQFVTDECWERLPDELRAEIITDVKAASGLTEEETEDVNFTASSPGQESPATGEKKPALTVVETQNGSTPETT